jgi:hypothetical protein
VGAPEALQLDGNHRSDIVDLPVPFPTEIPSEHFLDGLG